MDLKVESHVPEKSECEKEDQVFLLTSEVRSVLSKRRSPEARILTYEFFKKIYSSIEQEMLREEDPNSTACHDPYVQKLLEKLIVSYRKLINSISFATNFYYILGGQHHEWKFWPIRIQTNKNAFNVEKKSKEYTARCKI